MKLVIEGAARRYEQDVPDAATATTLVLADERVKPGEAYLYDDDGRAWAFGFKYGRWYRDHSPGGPPEILE